jgi:ABC-type glycerol-3-phosphate transport system substrate-binding protein
MQHRNKIWSTLTLMLIMAVVLAACGGSPAAPAPAEQPAEENPAPAQEVKQEPTAIKEEPTPAQEVKQEPTAPKKKLRRPRKNRLQPVMARSR